MQYWTCPLCQAHLDFGEKCDCREKARQEQERRKKLYKQEPGGRQFTFNWPLKEAGLL